MDEQQKKRDAIVERIRKLLALAGNNPNEHEAAAAAARAQEMLAEYNVTMEEVGHAQMHEHDPEFEFDDTIRTLSRPWRRQLGVMVAMMYFSKYFFTFHYEHVPRSKRKCGYIRHDIHNFVGARHNLMVAKMIYQYLTATIERLARLGAQSQLAAHRTSYQTSFQHACAMRLCQRIAVRIADAKAGKLMAPATGTALVVVGLYEKAEAQAAEYIKKKLGQNLVSDRKGSRILNEAGFREGRKAGDTISLEQQLQADEARARLGAR